VAYLVEAVRSNRVVVVIKRAPDYDAALVAFTAAKSTGTFRRVSFYREDDGSDKVLLKFVERIRPRNGGHRFAK